MTFKEAQTLMRDNWQTLAPQLVSSNPPHMVLECVIAPQGSRLETLGTIYEKMVDERIPNEEILLDMNLISSDLMLYVAFKMKGYIYFLPFDSYSRVPWRIDDNKLS